MMGLNKVKLKTLMALICCARWMQSQKLVTSGISRCILLAGTAPDFYLGRELPGLMPMPA